MKNLTLMGLLLFSLAQTSYAGLIDSELSLKIIYQRTSSSSIETIGFLTTATVAEPRVEFPSVNDLQVDGINLTLVDVSINAGDDFIEIDFTNVAGFSGFASGHENTYIFKFDSVASVNIIGAEIDSSVTTLGLTSSDVRFVGNELFINVESLAFNPGTFVRINLVVEEKDCIAKYLIDGSLNIPCVSVPDALGGSIYYQANMQFVPFSSPFSFRLTGAQQIGASNSESDCLAVFNADGILNLPCVSVPNSSGEEELFEAVMEFVPQTSPFIFELLDAHLKN